MYIGAFVPIRLIPLPLIKCNIPNTSKFLNCVYQGNINASAGITIVNITNPNNNFLNGNSYLANPYPAKEQMNNCINVRVIT